MDELQKDLLELQSLLASATRQRNKNLLELEIHKINDELKTKQSTNSYVIKPKVPPQEPSAYDVQIDNYAWDQSDKFFKFYITIPDVQTLDQNCIISNFTNHGLDLKVQNLKGKNHCLRITNLLHEIVPEKSYCKLKKDMVVVFLSKKETVHWSHVTSLDKRAADNKAHKMDVTKSDDPSQGLMNILQNLYEDGDDNMKRTIAKAWYESKEKGGNPELGM